VGTGRTFPVASLLSASASVTGKVRLKSLVAMRIVRMLDGHDILGYDTCATACDGGSSDVRRG
jgi:hypothetical protein